MTERGQAVTIRQAAWHCEKTAHPPVPNVSRSSTVKNRHTARHRSHFEKTQGTLNNCPRVPMLMLGLVYIETQG